MIRQPQARMIGDGTRLHLQDGPIDLIVEARGSAIEVRKAYAAATRRLTGLLDTLCEELPQLRKAADPATCHLKGRVARRMWTAVAPFAQGQFITPMAAVAGAVAEEILTAMRDAATLRRAYVNNGGDIALHLASGERFTVGLVALPNAPALIGTAVIEAGNIVRGIATSGWRGRSFSLGIADAVTVLARTASQADAAATIIANAVDLPGHPAILRRAANDIQPDNDLGMRPVTRHVGRLSSSEIAQAMEAGCARARDLVAAGLIEGAALHLQGETRSVGLQQRRTPSPGQIRASSDLNWQGSPMPDMLAAGSRQEDAA